LRANIRCNNFCAFTQKPRHRDCNTTASRANIRHKNFPEDECETYFEYISRRQTGEPLQYIIAQWEFMGVPLITDSRALIPRPETELLVEEASAFINKFPSLEGCREAAGWPQARPIRIADICTASGCIAIAVARLLGERAKIIATDISPQALSLARENAEKNHISPAQINFIETDLLDGIDEKFDVIISNPPYISCREMDELSPTVRDHEPHLALHGGTDGMDFYRRLIPQAKNVLLPGGGLFLEIGSPAVIELMQAEGFENVNLLCDYAELPRIVTGVTPC
jgi:release factor glutamine methyltransferase